MAEKEYREGDEETDPKEKPGPVTAFLVLLYPDGRVEAGTNLDNIPMARQANLRDIRDVCATLSKDVETTLTAKAVAGMVSQGITQSMRQVQADQMKQRIMQGGQPGPSGLQ